MMVRAFAVLGFRPHTYWTAVVALTGPPTAPQVIARRRIDFATGDERFVYHQAAEVDPARAEALIDKVRASTQANAVGDIAGLVADLQNDGFDASVAVIPTEAARPSERLEDILRVHARIHAAEGRFYRDVVASACAITGQAAHRVVERDLPGLVCDQIGITASALEARMKAMGAALGSPWNEDYRLATLAAWTRLD